MNRKTSLLKLFFGYAYIEAYPLLAGNISNENIKDVLHRDINLNFAPSPIYYHDIDITDALENLNCDYNLLRVASITGNSDPIKGERAIKDGFISIWKEVEDVRTIDIFQKDKAVIVKIEDLNDFKYDSDNINENWLCLRRIKSKIDDENVRVMTKKGEYILDEIINISKIHGEVLFSFEPKSRIEPSDVPSLISYPVI